MARSPNRPDAGFPRLYAILDVDVAERRALRPADILDTWLSAGVRLIQLRAKSLSFGPMLELAAGCADACRASGVRFIVNDRADVARLVDADGVHVGQDDLPVADVRRVLRPHQIVGLSTHRTEQTKEGLNEADYVAIGPVFKTVTKDRTDPTVGLAGVAAAAELAHAAKKPLVAIGGITADTAGRVIDSGADAVAVITDLLEGEWTEQVRKYLRILQ